MLSGSFTWLADTSNNGLDQTVNAFLFVSVHHSKAKLGFAIGPSAKPNRQLAAKPVFDKCCLVPVLFGIPGVNAQSRKIAGLAFRPARRRQKILRLVARRVAHAIQLEPRYRPDICGSRSFAYRIWQVHFDETGHYPAGDGHSLVARLRCIYGLSSRRGVDRKSVV